MAVRGVGIENKSQKILSSSCKENKEKKNNFCNHCSPSEGNKIISLAKLNLQRYKTQIQLSSARKLFNETVLTDKNISNLMKYSTTYSKTPAIISNEYISITKDKYTNKQHKNAESLNLIEFTPIKSETSFEETTNRIKIDAFVNSNNSLNDTHELKPTKICSPIRNSISEFEKISILSFEEAIYRFKNLKYAQIDQKI